MENITIIHLNESTPLRYIKSVGFTTSINAKINLKDFELEILDLFIEADKKHKTKKMCQNTKLFKTNFSRKI